MKYIWILICSIMTPFTLRTASAEGVKNSSSFYDQTLNSLRGEPIDFKIYRGNVSLVVNTASRCGFTSQYESLENLFNEFQQEGFQVLGFPSNDFGSQEPGSNQEIADFCKLNYGVTFPMFEKISVVGENKHQAYKILTEYSDKKLSGEIGWNFVKFLVDKNGVPRVRFSSMTRPENKILRNEIEKLLRE